MLQPIITKELSSATASAMDSPISVIRKSVDNRDVQKKMASGHGLATVSLPCIVPLLRADSFDHHSDDDCSKRSNEGLKLPQIHRDGHRLLLVSRDEMNDSFVNAWAPLSPTDKRMIDAPQEHLRRSYKIKAKSHDSHDFHQLLNRK